MLRIKLLLILSLVETVRLQATGVGYYGTSNVRTQGPNLPPTYRLRPLPPPGRLPPGGSPRPSYIPAYRPVLPPRPVAPVPRPASLAPPVVPPLAAALVRQPEPVPQPSPGLQPEPTIEAHPITEPIPEPDLDPQPETFPEPIPQTNLITEPIPEPEPIPDPELYITEPIPEPELYPQPEPLPDPVSEPIPQPEPLPDPTPELTPQHEPQPIPQLEPITAPETIPQPEPTPQPQPNPQPETIPQPQPFPQMETILEPHPIPQPPSTPKPESGGIALPPLLPKPKPERPPAFITRPPYSPEETPKPTDSPATLQPQPEPTTETLPPVTTGLPTATYKPIHGGLLESAFNCSKGNGYYAVDRYCDTYIECKDNIAVRYYCPDGLNFNRAAKWRQYPCAYPSEVPCEAGSDKQNPKPTNECPRQYGFFAMKDGECSKFIMCQEGKATVMDCPYGLAFNVETSSCDWPENVPLCNPYAFKDFECPESHVNQDGKISDYINKYRYGNQCKLYVACQRGHPRLLSCDPGLLFDEPSQSCIDEDLVTNCAAPYVL